MTPSRLFDVKRIILKDVFAYYRQCFVTIIALGACCCSDCGAGIGRVTKHLLLERFESVDVVEQSPRLLQAAPKYIGRDRDRAQYLCVGLQVRPTDARPNYEKRYMF